MFAAMLLRLPCWRDNASDRSNNAAARVEIAVGCRAGPQSDPRDVGKAQRVAELLRQRE
jgi:hypothetical protein